MAIRLVGAHCRVSASCTGTGKEPATHMYCVSRLTGLGCPRQGKQGARPFELCPECFKEVSGKKDLRKSSERASHK